MLLSAISKYYFRYLSAFIAESLSNLTYIVGFVVVSGGYHKWVMTIRCLKQIWNLIRFVTETTATRETAMDSCRIWSRDRSKTEKKKTHGTRCSLNRTIVENWSFQYLFLTVESIHLILNQRIYIDLNWIKTNITQQR